MPRLRVSERLRIRLRYLLKKRGTAAQLVDYSARRPGGVGIRAQDLSYFTHQTPGRMNPLTFDALDDIAAFFNCSIGDLLGVARPSDLSGDEQRIVGAFRALSDEAREAFLAMIEAASVVTAPTSRRRVGQTRIPTPDIPPQEYAALPPGVDRDAPSRALSPSDAIVALQRLLAYANTLAFTLGPADADTAPDRSLPSADADEAQHG